MVKHIIVWSLKDEYSDAEKTEIKKGIKDGLEGLKGKVPGIIDITVQTEGLESSSGDLMLDSTFESVEALNGYNPNLFLKAATISLLCNRTGHILADDETMEAAGVWNGDYITIKEV